MAAVASFTGTSVAARSGFAGKALRARSNGARAVMAADRPIWLPGNDFPAHLENVKLPGNYGFDPLGLGANAERLTWFAESERVHSRWAMLGVAGILAQEIVHPDQFWYTSGADAAATGPNVAGLLAVELFLMHWVETKRGLDVTKPGSQDQDPIFNYKLKAHETGYPGFAVFIPGDLEELKVKEIKNGRLAMLAFIGFTMAAQTTGLNPIAALFQHLADPINTSVFSKAAVVPGQIVSLPCVIPPSVNVSGLTIPTPCAFQALWP